MKSKTIIVSAVWILSLTAAYFVGAKITSGSQKTAEANDSSETSRPSYRSKITSSSADSRSKSGSRASSSSSSSRSQQNVADIITQNDPIKRFNDLLALIDTLGPNDFAQVVADFRTVGMTRERISEYSMLLHAWAKADPLGALDYAQEHTTSGFAQQTMLASWAADNPDAALQWAEANYDGDGQNPWVVGVIRGIANTNSQKATEIMNTMEFSQQRSQALQAIVPHITSLGQEKSIEWLESIEDERLRNGATRRVVAELAQQDPKSTAAWVTTLEAGDNRTRAIGEVADNWADADLASAVAWTETLQGAEKANAARELIGEYTREDAEQASQWVDSLAGSENYDRVADGFIWSAARNNPELALAKVSTIGNDRTHNRYYERILSNWHRSDAEATEAWMQANNVTDELRQRATRARNRGNRGR